MNAAIDSADGKTFFVIKNDSRIQTIASAHRVEAVRMFLAESLAFRMVSLRKETLSALKSSVAPLPSTASWPHELLMKLEDEAMRLFQTIRSHQDEALKMFESDAPASGMALLRQGSLAAMESAMAACPTPRPALQEFLVDAEVEAMAALDLRQLGAEEYEDDGVPARPFKSPRRNPGRAEPGVGGGSSSLPPQAGGSKDDGGDSESLSSLRDEPEEREVNVAIFYEEDRRKANKEGEHLKGNGSDGSLHPCNTTNSPGKQKVDQKQDATSQRKEVKKEDDDREHNAILKTFKGVEKTISYRASISYQGTMYCVGTYKLQADAALAHDEASQAAKESKYTTNFSVKADHIAMREKEMKTNGIKVNLEDVLAKISARVQRVLSKVRPPAKQGTGGPDENCNTKERSEHSSSVAGFQKQRFPSKARTPAKPVAVSFEESCNTKERSEHSSTDAGFEKQRGLSKVRAPAKQVVGSFDESFNTKERSSHSSPGAGFEKGNVFFESLKGFRERVNQSGIRYESRIQKRRKHCSLGIYELKSDAAFAYDVAGRALEGPEWSNANFPTKKDHISMREDEMKTTGLNVDLEEILAIISKKVKKVVSEFRSDSGRDGNGCVSNDDGSGNSDKCNHLVHECRGDTEPPTVEVLRWVRSMPVEEQRMHIAPELRVKVLYDDNVWYGGVVREVIFDIGGGRRIKISFDDGSEEMTDFPEKDVIVDDVGNGEHRGDASPFIPAADAPFDESCNSREVEEEYDDSVYNVRMKSLGGFGKNRANNYIVDICYQGKSYNVGTYKLQTDAALAHDEASKALWGPKHSKVNFSSKADHIALRQKEMESNGLQVDLDDVSTKISVKVKSLLSEIGAPTKRVVGDFDENCDTEERPEHSSPGPGFEKGNEIFKSLKGYRKRVHRSSGRISYQSYIQRGNRISLGIYELQSDAAFAYDIAGRALEGPEWGNANFATRKDYFSMREQEMRLTGLNVDLKGTLDMISMKAKEAILEFRPNSGRDGDGRLFDDNDVDSDNHNHPIHVSRTETDPPTVEVLRWVRSMPVHEQRMRIAPGLRVKVLYDENVWYGGVVREVMCGMSRGRRIKISFDEGSEETADFPDKDVIVDDVGNGEHRGDASAFVPAVDAAFDESCNLRVDLKRKVDQMQVKTSPLHHDLPH